LLPKLIEQLKRLLSDGATWDMLTRCMGLCAHCSYHWTMHPRELSSNDWKGTTANS